MRTQKPDGDTTGDRKQQPSTPEELFSGPSCSYETRRPTVGDVDTDAPLSSALQLTEGKTRSF